MLTINIQKSAKALSALTLLVASFGMQSVFADESSLADASTFNQPQTTLIGLHEHVQATLTLKMDEKLQNQLMAKNYNLEEQQIAEFAEPAFPASQMQLAANNL